MMRRTTAAGFSIIEVLLATTLLAVAIVALAQLFAVTTSMNLSARHVTLATLLATEKMEQLRALPIDDPALAPTATDALLADVDGYWDLPAPGVRRRWSVVPAAARAADEIVLQVVVWRPGGAGDARLVSIKTRKAP